MQTHCLGYPFHPSGKPDKLWIKHLKTIKTPTLIVQGQRDTLGNQEEVGNYKLSKHFRIHWLRDGLLSFKPRKASGQRWKRIWPKRFPSLQISWMLCKG